MVITMLEANVKPDQVEALLRAYHELTSVIPPEIVETFLVRDSADALRYQIITVWVSGDALNKMRASPEKPRGVLIFESVGASPTLKIVDVVERRHT